MPKRSKILELPEDIKTDLDRKLIANGFGGYVALAEWLQEQGYAISKSSVHSYGQKFEERLGALKVATQQARAIVESAPDQEGAMSEALLRLTQEKLFGVLLEYQGKPDKEISLPALSKAIAELNRSSVTTKKYAADVREKLEAKFAALEKESSDKGGKRKIDADTLRIVREEIYGVVV